MTNSACKQVRRKKKLYLREYWDICVLDFILSIIEEMEKDSNENFQLTNLLLACSDLEFTRPIWPPKPQAENLV